METASIFPQLLANALLLSSFYMLVATGLAIIFSVMRMVNFAHGSWYMVGGYIIYFWVDKFHLNYFLGIVVTVAALFAMGLPTEKFIMRRFQNDILGAVIVSLGVLMFLESGAVLVFGGDIRGLASPITGVAHIGTVVFSWARILPTILGVFIMAMLWLFLHNTGAGRAIRATAQNDVGAALQGVNTQRMRNMVYGIGLGLAGAAAAVTGPVFVVEPWMGGLALWKSLTVVIIGGMGSLPGCILGGLLVGFIDSFVTSYVNMPIAQLVGFAIIIILLMVRPGGIMGQVMEIH